tara:strand:+ start:524 stop:745 length:222 start_codon:yes stop_codon:yes gene_type:complete
MKKKMDRQEFIDEIERAIEMVDQARHIVDMAVDGMSIQANYEAYGKYGFDQLLGTGNPYDNSLQSLIDKTEEE